MPPRPLVRTSAVDALAQALRERILDGELPPGARLVERELCEGYDVARHTVRAALRSLAAEGLVQLVPDRGARVATLDPEGLRGLFELRRALELEAAWLALERHGGRIPPAVRDAVARLGEVCDAPAPAWAAVVPAHRAVHRRLVAAAESPRILTAYDALAAELQLFVVALEPHWSFARMAAHHTALLDGLEREGPAALRRHLDEGEATVRAGLA